MPSVYVRQKQVNYIGHVIRSGGKMCDLLLFRDSRWWEEQRLLHRNGRDQPRHRKCGQPLISNWDEFQICAVSKNCLQRNAQYSELHKCACDRPSWRLIAEAFSKTA